MLRILHLSDVHFGAQHVFGEQERIADLLIKAAHDNKKPDLCIFSGDLGYDGQASQFDRGAEWLRRLLEPWPGTDLLILPGNHDVQRRRTSPDLFRSIGAGARSYADWRRRLAQHSSSHLQEFFQWHHSASSQLPLKLDWRNPFGCSYQKMTRDCVVNVLCLNSALFSCDDKDHEHLVVDIEEINSFLGSVGQGGLKIVVAHHPFSELIKWNRDEVERLFSQETGFHLFLHGHVHDQSGVFASSTRGQSLAVLGVGAAYQGSEFPQYFAFYDLDFRRRELSSLVYRYRPNSGLWLRDEDLSRPVVLRLPVETGLPKQNSPSRRRASRTPIMLDVDDPTPISNARYPRDISRLVGKRSAEGIVTPETIFIVLGTTLFAELLDRPLAYLLRDHIDFRGGEDAGRRAIVISDIAWDHPDNEWIRGKPVIAIGAPEINNVSARFESSVTEDWEVDKKEYFDKDCSQRLFFHKPKIGGPQGGVWGGDAIGTKEAVQRYCDAEQGLAYFLRYAWPGP